MTDCLEIVSTMPEAEQFSISAPFPFFFFTMNLNEHELWRCHYFHVRYSIARPYVGRAGMLCLVQWESRKGSAMVAC